jgi:hypothetical protein
VGNDLKFYQLPVFCCRYIALKMVIEYQSGIINLKNWIFAKDSGGSSGTLEEGLAKAGL